MDISKIDVNFSKIEASLDGKDVYSILDSNFDLYGVKFNEKVKCFERIPTEIAEKTSYGVSILNKTLAGGRLRFSTNSSTITIYCKYDALHEARHMPLSGISGFSLFCNLENNKNKHLKTFIPTYDDKTFFIDTVSLFENTIHSGIKKNVVKNYTLYLPLYNESVKEVYIAFDKGSVVGKGKKYENIKPILYYGSSITQGGCASRPDNCYQNFIEKSNNVDFINLGYSGACKGEDVIVDYLTKIDCSIFVLDYDHNTPTVEHLKNTHFKVYEKFRKNFKDTPVVMLSAVDCDYGYIEKRKRRNVVKESYLKALSLGDKNVYFIDGKNLIPRSVYESAFVEGVHPNDLGFYYMSKSINKVLTKILKTLKK